MRDWPAAKKRFMARKSQTQKLEERLAKVQALATERENEIQRMRRSEGRAWERVETLEKILGRVAQLSPSEKQVPTWVAPKRKTKAHMGTPVLVLSDFHLDEVVDRGEMDGMNEYNREIAEARLDRVVNFTVDYLRTYTAGVTFEGIVVPMLGDIIAGAIHEELAKTNESPMPATIVHWVPKIASALTYLADEFGRVFVPTVDGNHDRVGKHIQYKNRAEESFAWIVYHWLADSVKNDDRITFSISQSPEHLVTIHDTTFLLAHGDGTRGGQGIGGIWPPILRYVTKKQDSYSAIRKSFDYALLGHWHQLVWGPNFIINGSMIGYNEYARGLALRYERPQQALFLVTPENGITTRAPIFCEDPA